MGWNFEDIAHWPPESKVNQHDSSIPRLSSNVPEPEPSAAKTKRSLRLEVWLLSLRPFLNLGNESRDDQQHYIRVKVFRNTLKALCTAASQEVYDSPV